MQELVKEEEIDYKPKKKVKKVFTQDEVDFWLPASFDELEEDEKKEDDSLNLSNDSLKSHAKGIYEFNLPYSYFNTRISLLIVLLQQWVRKRLIQASTTTSYHPSCLTFSALRIPVAQSQCNLSQSPILNFP